MRSCTYPKAACEEKQVTDSLLIETSVLCNIKVLCTFALNITIYKYNAQLDHFL